MRVNLLASAIVALAIFGMSSCTGNVNKTAAFKALQAQGFVDIELTDYSYFGCVYAEPYRTGFVAKAANGQFVKGAVCSSFLSGVSVRYE